MYGNNVSSECIEHLRLKHRLRVVRHLEDSLEKNTLRALQQDKLLEPNELQVGKYSYFIHFEIFSIQSRAIPRCVYPFALILKFTERIKAVFINR